MQRLKLFLVSVGCRTSSFPYATPPLGILYLAAYVRARLPHVDVRVYDQRILNAPNEEVVNQALAFEPDIVGYSLLTSFSFMLTSLTERMHEALPKALQVIGGPHSSAFQADALSDNVADMAVIGEGECSLEKIILAFGNGGSYESVPGLIWRDKDGILHENPGSEIPTDLDSLPFPAYDLLDIRPYWEVKSMSALPVKRYVSFFSSRGCPYRCIYCHNIFGKHFRAHSAARIAAEVEYFTRMFGVREIEFLDDMFNCDKRRVLDFCEWATQKDLNLRINFPNSLRTDVLDEETIVALADAGVFHASFALETASPRLQKFIRKNLNIPRFLENVRLAVKHGIFANGFNMLGFPTETEEDLRTTIDVACESMFHTATFFTVIPYPRTHLHEIASKMHPEKVARIDYRASDYHEISVNFSDIPDERFFALQRHAWRKFFLNPIRLARIARDFPEPMQLPLYFPRFLRRQFKMFWGKG